MLPLIKSIIKGPLHDIGLLFSDPYYRKWMTLETTYKFYPRFRPFKTKIDGYTVTCPDSKSFLYAYKDIFLNHQYRFPCSKQNPFIIDLGANIGISLLYFKKLYPEASILALEADPQIFQFLTDNVAMNGLSGIELVNKAAWYEEAELKFCSKGDDSGRISAGAGPDTVDVEAVDVSALLGNNHVDLLKIDIEGAESQVLQACDGSLGNVDRIVLEYHSKPDDDQPLDTILQVLKRSGFRIHLAPGLYSPNPFVDVKLEDGHDMLLLVYAWRA